MHLMEIKSPSKSHTLFYEMQNELHCIVTEQRQKKPQCLLFCLSELEGNKFFKPSVNLETYMHISLAETEKSDGSNAG